MSISTIKNAKPVNFKIDINKIYQTESDAKNGINNVVANVAVWTEDNLNYVDYGDGTALIYNGDVPIGWTTIEEIESTTAETTTVSKTESSKAKSSTAESTSTGSSEISNVSDSDTTTKTLSNGSTQTTKTENGVTTTTIKNAKNITTYEKVTNQSDGTIIEIKYNETTGKISSKSTKYENGYTAIQTFSTDENGNSITSKYTLTNAKGEKVVNLTEPMKWVKYGDNEYHINEDGTLSINPLSEYKLSEDGKHYYRVNDNGIVTITSTNGNGTGDIVDYMSVSEAKTAGYISSGYSFTPKYSLSYDGYYYPTSANGINPTNDTGSCVWYVVGRINEVRDELGISGDWSYHGYGSQWYSSANSEYGSSSDINDVRAGAVLSYSPNHVAYVESVNGDSVTISEANVGTSNTAGFRCSTVSKSELENLYGKSLQGMVFTLPE